MTGTTKVNPKQVWQAYPDNFCAREVGTLVGWARAGMSGALVGLPGSGKSHLLGFLCRRPDVVARTLGSTRTRLAVVQVDLNNLPGADLATFYRVILRALYEAHPVPAAVDPALGDAITALYRKVEAQRDPFLAQSALREVLIAFRERDVRLALVLDPFDAFCRMAPTRVLDNLRGLRDGFKATLSYIVGLRQELTYVRAPLEMGELYELLDTHVCWVGRLTRDDARHSLAQVVEATGRSFDREQAERLIDLTGGYPALLRAAAVWLAGRAAAPQPATFEGQLLAQPAVQNRLRDLWQGLTGEEQAVLCALQDALSASSPVERRECVQRVEERHAGVLDRLEARDLCCRIEETKRIEKAGTPLRQFSIPLLARFVAHVGAGHAGRVRHEAVTDRFFRGETELTALSEQDRRLLHCFLERPLIVHALDDLVEAAWPDCEGGGVSNQAVQQAIRHLRKNVEPDPARPTYLITEHGVGYRFFPEGAPGR